MFRSHHVLYESGIYQQSYSCNYLTMTKIYINSFYVIVFMCFKGNLFISHSPMLDIPKHIYLYLKMSPYFNTKYIPFIYHCRSNTRVVSKHWLIQENNIWIFQLKFLILGSNNYLKYNILHTCTFVIKEILLSYKWLM